MNERRFDIIFNGNISDDVAISDVKQNIKQLFNIDDLAVEQMFSGENICIKQNLDRQTATHYQAALNKAGAKIQLALHKPKANTETTSTQLQATDNLTASQLEQNHNADTPIATSNNQQLKDGEKQKTDSTHIDTSHIQLETQAPISNSNPFLTLDTSQPTYPSNQHIQADSDFTVAEAGSDLLRANEKKVFRATDIDTSQLNIIDEPS